jgi:hypothetical protein
VHNALKSLLAIGLAAAPVSAAPAASAQQQIGWNDLRQVDGTATANSRDPGGTLSWNLQGKTVELAGYVLPSDREGDLVYQFLLIPWTGLCSHMPPPPPNQAVLITLKEPYKLSETYETVSVTGTLVPELETTQLFILDGVSVIESGYRISGARIAPADKVIGAEPQPKTNPWSLITKKAGG